MDSLNIENGIAGNFGLDHLLETFEKRTIEKALAQAQGSKVEAAKLLGITFRSLRYRLAKHGLLEEEEEGADDKENM